MTFSTNFPIVKLGNLIVDIYRYPTFYGIDYIDCGVGVLKGENITREGDWQKLDKIKFIASETSQTFSRTILNENDLVMTVRGEVGKVALVNKQLKDYNINGNVIKITLKDSFNNIKICPRYIWQYLNSGIGKTFLKQKIAGAVQETITVNEIMDVDVILPTYTKQLEASGLLKKAKTEKNKKLNESEELPANVKFKLFNSLGIYFEEYMPSLYSYNQLKNIRKLGIYCNPHSDYLNSVFNHLMGNNCYAGHLEDFVEINPATRKKELSADSVVSFVPMTAVEEKNNEVVYEAKPYNEVKTGFTCFKKGDLLWAKITPCMQNGKSFIASDMPTEIGFGSTEFHVLRQKSDRIYMPYLWVILSDKHILEAAQGMFSGSAGQQRVPDTFLKKLPIVLPPVEMQKKLANEVFEALKEMKRLRQEAEQEWQDAKKQFEKELLGK